MQLWQRLRAAWDCGECRLLPARRPAAARRCAADVGGNPLSMMRFRTERGFNEAERSAIVALLREYEAGIGVSLCFQDFDAEMANLPGDYAPPKGEMLLARDTASGALVGCVAVRPVAGAPELCEMKRLYLRAAARGKVSAGIWHWPPWRKRGTWATAAFASIRCPPCWKRRRSICRWGSPQVGVSGSQPQVLLFERDLDADDDVSAETTTGPLLRPWPSDRQVCCVKPARLERRARRNPTQLSSASANLPGCCGSANGRSTASVGRHCVRSTSRGERSSSQSSDVAIAKPAARAALCSVSIPMAHQTRKLKSSSRQRLLDPAPDTSCRILSAICASFPPPVKTKIAIHRDPGLAALRFADARSNRRTASSQFARGECSTRPASASGHRQNANGRVAPSPDGLQLSPIRALSRTTSCPLVEEQNFMWVLALVLARVHHTVTRPVKLRRGRARA